MTDTVLVDGQALESTVRRAAAGDEAAFARLVSAHHAQLARVAYVTTGDAELAREAVQSAWLVAWRRLDTLRDPRQIQPWLVAIAANEARLQIRKSRRHRVVEIAVVDGWASAADPADDIGELDLARALARLKPEERALLGMRYVAGLDSGEIARVSGMTASGVRSRLMRLLDRLRVELDHDR